MTARLLCATLSGIAVASLSEPQAAMTEAEQETILPALINTLNNLSEQAKKNIDRYSSPVLVLAGLALWGLRISHYAKVPAKLSKVSTGSQPVPPPAPVSTDGDQQGFPVESLIANMSGGVV